MEPTRRARDRMPFVLFILGNIATALSGLTLNCTNDYDEFMFCQLEAQNCTEYRMILQNDSWKNKQNRCAFEQCDAGPCCCSIQMTLVKGETHTATVWKRNKTMESKIINVIETIKPKTPTIVSVKESNGNFQVKWKTNYDHTSWFSNSLNAIVTYHKKGDKEEHSKSFKPSQLDGDYYYEILGGPLEPNTKYEVSVKSVTNNKFSDSSKEGEFTTLAVNKDKTLPAVALIISLSVAAVLISVAMYGCYIKLKTKWSDIVAKCPNPKLLLLHSSEQEVLKPAPPILSSVWVDSPDPEDSTWSEGSMKDISSGSPQQSNGISTGSSCLSYAKVEPTDIIARVQDALCLAFPDIRPMSPLTTNLLTEPNKNFGLPSSPYKPFGVRADDTSIGSYCFDNQTYCSLLPNFDGSDVKAEILCDSEYLHSSGDIVPRVDQQALACPLFKLPPGDSALMPIDMSYQQNNADSWGVSHAEDSSLSSGSSGTNTNASCDHVSGVKSDGEGFDEAVHDATKLLEKTEGVIICDENPFYGGVPAGLQSLLPVYDDYQPFQSLVEQPGHLFTEEKRGEKEEHVNTYPEESFPKMPQSFLGPLASGFINNVQCPSTLQTQFLSVIPADQSMPIITDSGYHSV
ncbi:uncharacterized protein LOC117471795 isoform X2 [Trematomus bernacchii]|uniref:uncharacterized protein LOC117471795 isoform X2 n=1 Tax=Trematomus bernacchii TaxID=40690 RepID=UPI00146E80F9|nr:uncharacterized protein LOC117471795 isoform X2 [Trematomus bernacchii]